MPVRAGAPYHRPMAGEAPNPWVQREYARGGPQFDRVIFFCDAVFAIALTLAAVRIEVPAVTDGDSSQALWSALTDKGPALLAFAITFFWVAFYWRANHKFTATLRAMDGAYIAAMLVYLAFIALLPWPSSVLGEYTENPVAIAFFAVWVAAVSSMEVVLIVVAQQRGLYVRQLTRGEYIGLCVGSLTPVVAALALAALVFVSIWAGLAAFFAVVTASWFVGRRLDDPTSPHSTADGPTA